MILRLLAAALLACALPCAGQAVPAANYTDMWYNAPAESESGWGISFVQHADNQVYAVWFTYDPREPGALPGRFRPLWIVMSGGTWTNPTTLTGPVYVLNGTPFNQAGSNRTLDEVGRFTFRFTDASNGTFTYNIAPPAGIPASHPAFGLPAFSGTRNITRQSSF